MSRAWLALACAVAGCSGDPGTKGTPGTEPTEPTDGSTPDTAATPTGALETLRVVTYGDDQALVGADLLVSDADGGVVGLFTTDDAGEVRVDVPVGGSASLAQEYGGTRWLATTFDIPEGGTATFVSTEFFSPGSTSSTESADVHQITSTASASPPEVVRWLFYTRCDGGNANSPGPWTFDDARCTGEPTDQLLVLGFDAVDDLVAWGADFDVPLSADIAIDVSLTQTTFTSVDVTFTGVPSGASGLSASLNPHRDGWTLYAGQWGQQKHVGSDASATVTIPDLHYDGYTVGASVDLGEDAGLSRYVSSDSAPEPFAWDLSDLSLIQADPPDLGVPGRPVLSWIATVGDRGDFGQANLGWSTATDSTVWTATFDPQARLSVQLPSLPPEWADYGFAPEVVTPMGVWFGDYDFLDGYEDLIGWDQVFPAQYGYSDMFARGGEYQYL